MIATAHAAPAPDRLSVAANRIAARLGGPVYLVGSALHDLEPDDIDVRVVLVEADLRRLFGPPDTRAWRIRREELAQSRALAAAIGRNVDFQIQTVEDALAHVDEPRRRLDQAPPGFFL